MGKQVRERRTLSMPAHFEVRAVGDGTVGIRGYAATFDSVAYGEVVRSSAFEKTLAEQDDVRLLVNHDGVPVARTKSGTLTLSTDDVGLVAEAPSLDAANPTVAELVSAMGRGDIDQMSFAFTPVREVESVDDNGDTLSEIIECRLWDVSVVTFPWYEDSMVEISEFDLALADLHAGRELSVSRRSLLLEKVAEPVAEPVVVERCAGVSMSDIDSLYI